MMRVKHLPAEFLPRKVLPVPRLSIVIPCVGGSIEFEDTLVSVLQNRPAQCEVIVVHVLPYDDPYGLQEEVRFIRVSGKPSLVQLANTGLEAARSEIVHFLGCRLTVLEGWAETALEHFEESHVAAVSPLVIAPHDRRVTSAGVNYSAGGKRKIAGLGLDVSSRKLAKLKVAGPTLEAGFYRREVVLALGGWHEALGEVAADVDLGQSLAALQQTTVVATGSVLHELRPAANLGGFTHGRAMERLFWRQFASANPVWAILCHCARRDDGNGHSVAQGGHPHHAAGSNGWLDACRHDEQVSAVARAIGAKRSTARPHPARSRCLLLARNANRPLQRVSNADVRRNLLPQRAC